jgi:hypothetical protein
VLPWREEIAMHLTHGATSQREASLRRLVSQQVLSIEQVDAVLEALGATEVRSGRRTWWIEALGYVGGGLMLAGAGTLVGVSWDVLNRSAQVAILAAATLVLVGAAIAAGGGPSGLRRLEGRSASVRRRIVGVLFALASGVAALTVGVAVDNDPQVLAPTVGLAAATFGYVVVRTAPGLLATALFSLSVVATAGDDLNSPVLATAFEYLALGAIWTVLALSGVLASRVLGLGIGVLIAFIGAQQPIGTPGASAWAYALTLVVGVACFVLYRMERTLVLLIGGVAGFTVAVPEAAWDITNGAGGAAAILLIAGAVLLGASGLGLRMHRPSTPR